MECRSPGRPICPGRLMESCFAVHSVSAGTGFWIRDQALPGVLCRVQYSRGWSDLKAAPASAPVGWWARSGGWGGLVHLCGVRPDRGSWRVNPPGDAGMISIGLQPRSPDLAMAVRGAGTTYWFVHLQLARAAQLRSAPLRDTRA